MADYYYDRYGQRQQQPSTPQPQQAQTPQRGTQDDFVSQLMSMFGGHEEGSGMRIPKGYELSSGAGRAPGFGAGGPPIKGFEFASLLSPYIQNQGARSFSPLEKEAYDQLYARQNQRQQVSQLMNMLMGGMSGKGMFGLPNRADLLNPRLADIAEQAAAGRARIGDQFAGTGRALTGSVAQQALGQLGSREMLERQRATGDVDTLLAQLGSQQGQQMIQLIMSLLSGGI